MIIKLYNDRQINSMNKTVNILLKIARYALALLLGAGGTYTLMQ